MQKKMQWDLTRLALQAARRILFRRWKFRWSEAQANFSGRRTVVGGTHVVSGACVVRGEKKMRGVRGGSPPAKPVKGGVWRGFAPPAKFRTTVHERTTVYE